MTAEEARAEGMIEYLVVSKILARPMSREAAGRRGYLDHYKGKGVEKNETGYAVLNPYTGLSQWMTRRAFMHELLEKGNLNNCRNCIRWNAEDMYCDHIGAITSGNFGCNRFFDGVAEADEEIE